VVGRGKVNWGDLQSQDSILYSTAPVSMFSKALREWHCLRLSQWLLDWFENHDQHVSRERHQAPTRVSSLMWDVSSANVSPNFDCLSFRLLPLQFRISTKETSAKAHTIMTNITADDYRCCNYSEIDIDGGGDVAFDSESILHLPTPGLSSLSGRLDILMHPTYSVPCPYISLWESSGQPLSIEEIEMLFGLADQSKSNGSELIAEENPLTNRPSFALHVCGIGERLQEMYKHEEDVDKDEERDTAGQICETTSTSLTWFLKWLVLVGPKIGFPVSPSLFQHLGKYLRGGV